MNGIRLPPELVTLVTKLKATNSTLYVASVPASVDGAEDQIVVFRPLSEPEIERFASLEALGDVDEAVVQTAVLYPAVEPWESSPLQQCLAGVVSAISEAVRQASSFVDSKGLALALQEGRRAAQGINRIIDAFILKHLPGSSPEGLAALPMADRMRLLGMAEMVSGQEFPLKEILNPKPKVSPIPWHNLRKFTQAELEDIRGNPNKMSQLHDEYEGYASGGKAPSPHIQRPTRLGGEEPPQPRKRVTYGSGRRRRP